MSRALLVLTTCATQTDAQLLATALVERRLAACVNVIPDIASIYRWEGRVQQERESLLVIKTTEERLKTLEETIREISRYELPEVLVLAAAGGSGPYLEWLNAAVARELP